MQKTPSQKWTERIAQYRMKCQNIMELSKSIRYVGLINEYGRTLTGIFRPGLNVLLSNEPARNEFFLVSTMLAMRSKASLAIGNMDSAVLRHDRVTIIVFQRKEGIYYISVNKIVAPDAVNKIIAKIKKII
ncbi:hypothetical protein [Candidatus Nitrosotalea okcheonensis]|uniref:Roadblock/LAMTOR2 domain-containing protein n=1 Tax=Candidatus Nitrosotalea okcheonensis TaxID=1903276 RepID=A0A2H1FD90_9ARCH|nr:hypothetical protein [Candidatus Nitrosotalea okcheonensis]MDE1729007.1 hypothetical protein [Nitrososphaerota archaeon]MDE1841639.1 hypothetical protein [Nitrososphaerota archaeon]MDE1878516.1 hypothetical protein [Nitrososphaerota archaeon]SMH70742.1 conserved protein of unknown function [Candidatus Nitrosotalea okcheonensis]